MNKPSEITFDSLKNALMELSIHALRAFARATGVDYQQQWSGLDLVVHARRWATYQQKPDEVMAIDRTVASAWEYVAQQLIYMRANTGKENSELLGARWVKALGLLTERFPSVIVHEAFILAMLAVARHLGTPSASARATLSAFRAHVEPEAKLFTPIWLRTINRAAPGRLREVFRDCGMMFYPGDYFVGYVVAWRFGAEVATRYANVLSHTMPQAQVSPLPLGSERQLDELKHAVIDAMSVAQFGTLGASTEPADLFAGLRGPLTAWSQWLASVFRDSPGLVSMMPSIPDSTGVDSAVEDILVDADPADEYLEIDAKPEARFVDSTNETNFALAP